MESRQARDDDRTTDASTKLSDDDDDDEDEEADSGATFTVSVGKDPSTRQTMRQGGTLLFTRKHEEKQTARLQDFIITKLIGKGAFGKVYLVRHRTSGRVYAMKCIRKDVVID